MTDPSIQKDTETENTEVLNRFWTIPNILCLVRLGGAFVLIPIALQGYNATFLWVFLALATTDWLDGKLAILLNQRSVFGARLDSWADAALYAALVFGVMAIYSDVVRSELTWILLALGSYLVSTLAGLYKYRRWPSYHTRAAKTSWLLTALAVFALFTDWAVWPIRVAALAVFLTNIEALAITAVSPRWRADVTSIYHASRDNRLQENSGPD